jgi:di/tricarboxylate transporter
MFVISGGMMRTGVVTAASRRLLTLAGGRPVLAVALLLVSVGVLSAFVNNTPIVVMTIPVALSVAHAHGVLPSKLLIPLSYASILGGSCTLLGTSTNLVVSSMAEKSGLEPIGLFELAPLGILLAVVGLVYLVVAGRWLLPERPTVTTSTAEGTGREYVTELVVRAGSPLVGRVVGDTPLHGNALKVLQVIRGDDVLWEPVPRVTLAAGDVLIARGGLSELRTIGLRDDLDMIPELAPSSVRIDAVAQTLAEIVVTPGSRLVGATIPEIGFRAHFGVTVLAVQRHGHHEVREKLARLILRTGDVVLVQGEPERVAALRNEDGMLLLEGADRDVEHRERAPVAIAILVAVVLLGGLTPLPLVACAIGGALAMALTGCVSLREAYTSLDLRTLVLVAGMMGFGLTAEQTGVMAWLSGHLMSFAGPLGPYGVLAVVYLLASVLTEIISNAAAAVLMVPLAIGAAVAMGVDARPFVVAVAFAASASFATPVGYQTNTLVYGPGGYRFRDFLVVGMPLNLLAWVISVVVIPLLWPF